MLARLRIILVAVQLLIFRSDVRRRLEFEREKVHPPRAQLKRIVTDNDNADYAFYGLAVLASMTGDSHTCLEHLTEAIRHNPRNRIQARSDSDFQDMADDPRFTELLYPEI